jgi:hypothetical protein
VTVGLKDDTMVVQKADQWVGQLADMWVDHWADYLAAKTAGLKVGLMVDPLAATKAVLWAV